ncbi:MAG: hypothetical protein ACTHOH_05495 [Lysobacteraceae bacterium]
MATVRYRIPDEPRPTGLVRYAVDPMWPLLACMLGGNAIGLLWFAFNTRALGSVSAAREWAYIAASLAGCMLVHFALQDAYTRGWLVDATVPYAVLAFPALKITLAYLLYISQARSAELLAHYGGVLRNGAVGLFGAFLLAHNVIDKLELPLFLQQALR